jgi:transcriptional regulator with XRE-family HTH domain
MKTSKKNKQLSEVGQRVAEARRRVGLTQVQLAEKLGVSQQVITFWEREAPAPKAEMLAKLSQVLGASADDLLGISEKIKKKGPTSRLEQCFEVMANMPRRKQERILGIVETIIQQA